MGNGSWNIICVFHFNVVRVSSNAWPTCVPAELYYEKKKGGPQPLLGILDPEKGPFIRVPTASGILTTRYQKDGADVAAFETIRIGLFLASMNCSQCT